MILFPVYLYHVLDITLIDRIPASQRAKLTPFWEFRELLMTSNKAYWLEQIGGNLIMLFPLGLMLPLISRRFRKFPVLFVTAFGFSVLIELTQYFTGRGLLEFDDIFHNTIGAIIGFAVWKILYKKINSLSA